MATKEVKARFKITDGKITMLQRKMFEKEMVSAFGENHDFIIGTFRKPKKKRSNEQNSFYWGITILEVTEALVGVGYDRDALDSETVHDFLTDKFLKFELPSSDYTGEFITIKKRSKELTTSEFMEYQDRISKWAQEFLGVTLSVPEEQKEINFL